MEQRRGVASFCSKYGQGVTNRAKQPAGHSRFLLLMAIFGPKSARHLGERLTNGAQVFVIPYFHKRDLCRETCTTLVSKTLVICECKNDFPIQTTIFAKRT